MQEIDMKEWLGDNDHAAFSTNSGYIIIDRDKTTISYSVMNKDGVALNKGYMDNMNASMNDIARMIAEQNDMQLMATEIYADIIMLYVQTNL